ncbi:hypothetical protein ACL6C3_06800 [Capilliphycus salinus ALCB114379]|uniref:hypothetical protein n=1 Tax=Capilliphycus salinus TaxID=2768948 RepID=UPI0039A78119
MESRDRNPNDPQPTDLQGLKLPSDFLLSITTAPVILMLMGGKVVADTILDLSRSSEAVFQGDRLPVLNFPHYPPEAEE